MKMQHCWKSHVGAQLLFKSRETNGMTDRNSRGQLFFVQRFMHFCIPSTRCHKGICSCKFTLSNGVAECRKSYAHQRETFVSSNDSLQLHPFSKWELLLKERICSQRERILSFKSSSLRYGILLLPHKVSSLECYYLYYTHAYTALWELRHWFLCVTNGLYYIVVSKSQCVMIILPKPDFKLRQRDPTMVCCIL